MMCSPRAVGRGWSALAALLWVFAAGCADGASEFDVDAGSLDGKFEENQPPGSDSGAVEDDSCGQLVNRACGPTTTECQNSGSCEAAKLIAQYEPQRCGESLSNPDVFPTCTENACARLVRKVCGDVDIASAACHDAVGCPTAATLRDRAQDQTRSAADREDALETCALGLEDEVVFPACPG